MPGSEHLYLADVPLHGRTVDENAESTWRHPIQTLYNTPQRANEQSARKYGEQLQLQSNDGTIFPNVIYTGFFGMFITS